MRLYFPSVAAAATAVKRYHSAARSSAADATSLIIATAHLLKTLADLRNSYQCPCSCDCLLFLLAVVASTKGCADSIDVFSRPGAEFIEAFI